MYSTRNRDKTFSFTRPESILLTIYAIITLIGTLHHEIWIDESHHWLIARDSSTLRDLWHNSRYEGHPLLWNLILFVITRFTNNPIYMQWTHWAIALVTCFIFLKYAKWPTLIKYSFPFGYFILYEYAVISRNYMLGVLFLFLLLSTISNNKKHILLSVYLALLANTHLFGLILSAGITIYFVLKNKFNHQSFQKKQFLLSTSILIIGWTISIWQIIPPLDHFLVADHNSHGLLSAHRIGKTMILPFRAFFNIPSFVDDDFWGSNFFTAHFSKTFSGILGILGLLIPLLIFFNKPKSLLLFSMCALGMMLFSFISPLNVFIRHSGYLYLAFIAAYWLGLEEQSSLRFSKKMEKMLWIQFWQKRLLYAVILIQVLPGVYAIFMEIKTPFSQSHCAVEFLTNENLSHAPIAVTAYGSGPTVSALLGKKVFYPAIMDYGSFCQWKSSHFSVGDETLFTRLTSFTEQQSNDVILLKSQHPLSAQEIALAPKIKFTLLKTCDGGVINTENFYVYRMRSK